MPLRITLRTGRGSAGSRPATALLRLRLLGEALLLASQQALAGFVIGRQVNAGPGHRQGAILESFVCVRSDAVSGKFRLVVNGGQGINANHGMDGRHGEGDVAHVGGTCGAAFPFSEIGEAAAESFGIFSIKGGHGLVMEHLGVRFIAAGDSNLGAGSKASGFEAAVDLGTKFGELPKGFGTDDVFGGSVGGDDVGSCTAIGDDAVDAVGRANVLAEEAQRCLRDGERVGGVYTKFGEGGGVGFLAGAMHFKHGGGDDLCADHVKGGGVNHHGGVDASETAALEKQDFSAGVAHFFGRRADDADGEPDLIGDFGRRERGADG